MNASRWSELQDRFDELCELSAGERAAHLAAPGLDPELRAQLSRMLEAHGEDHALALESRLDSTSIFSSPTVPHAIGPYRLVRLLGRGGMGEVWLAERDEDGFARQVAVKRIRRGFESEDIRDRFRLERAVLARFSHPGIARLLDGGVDEEGVPYLVLEYVEGVPITQYCDDHHLGLEHRLRLFEDVCRAVEVAHAHLIVHRDLKPSNILVDAQGEVRLLDFGIAKLLDPAGFALSGFGSAAPQTRTALLLATPEYAAPEQLRGESVTTATDLWALGVLLAELLAGRRPFAEHEGTLLELERALSERQPPRPSELVRRLPIAQAESVAAARNTTPERLARDLEGDLDILVLAALAVDPARRLPSAERLGDDLRRYRAGLPVLARPDTVRYRLGKFVRRHRAAVAAGVAALLVLVAFSVVTALQALALARQRDLAESERDAAREVSEVLISLFSADPHAEEQRYLPNTSLGEFLDGSAGQVRGQLADRPLLKAKLLTLLARFHTHLGRLQEGKELAEEAVALREAAGDTTSAEYGETLTAAATALQELGEDEPAERLFRRALVVREAQYGPVHPVVAEAVNNLAVFLASTSPRDSAEVEALEKRGLALRRQLFGSQHLDTAQSLNNLAVFYYLRRSPGDLEQGISLLREALAIRLGQLGEDHATVAVTRNNLANLLLEHGQIEEAEGLFRAAIAGWTKSVGPDHPRLARGYFGLHKLLARAGRLEEAREALVTAMEIEGKALPPDHPAHVSSQQAMRELEAKLAEASR